jgi:signal transduction histidine kinase
MAPEPRRRRAWYRSLYWRIAAGFVLFLAATLAVQAVLFLRIVSYGEGDVSPGALQTFAAAVANDVAAEVEANRAAKLDAHLVDRYGSLPRRIWVILADGRVISGRWGPPPPGLVAGILARLRGEPPPPMPVFPERPPPSRLLRLRAPRPAMAPVVVGGQRIGIVIVQAGRPTGRLAQEMGPILLAMATVLVLAAGGLAAVLIFRPAHRRLQGLIDAARRLGAGDLVARAPEAGGDEISGVARAFNQMADALDERARQLQASDRARRQLLADVSHELMTPLTAIRGYVETLSMPGIDLPESSKHRYLGIVGEETERLERIIRELLDLARLEAGGGALTMAPLAVEELFGRVRDRHGQAAQSKGVTLIAQAAEGLTLVGDRMRLEQALQNLAANALRHTPPSGTVQLTAERSDDGVTIRVRDSGEGIDAEHLPHLFDRFYKADTSRAESGDGTGSGLGLSIVKAIVERHDGRITVASTPGSGTVFEILLPDRAG